MNVIDDRNPSELWKVNNSYRIIYKLIRKV
jgi:hypothetical protein